MTAERKPVGIVAHYRAGDQVPEWLFEVEPKDESATFEGATFGVDCVLVEIEDGIVILPCRVSDVLGPDGQSYAVFDGNNLIVRVVEADVIMPISWQILRRPERSTP